MKQKLISLISLIVSILMMNFSLGTSAYADGHVPESKDPDFIIRTGGQIRLSNFMLWQSAYAELYFTKVLWPDFKISNLNKALDQLMKRKRNYGQ